METECDFMEIDNNIASRLQVPCLQQQKESEMPETLPVPMLANFDHFQPDNDEKESSFMTNNIEDKEDEENAGSCEPVADFENDEVSESNGEKLVGLDNASSDVLLKNEEFVGNDEEAVSTFVQGQQEDQSGESVSIFCVDSKDKSTGETRSNCQAMSINDSFSDNEPRTEDKIAQSDQQCDQGNDGDTILCPDGSDPLGNQMSHPLIDLGSDYVDTGRTESVDREFVFVNRDGTARVSPSHPLERSDEYYY